MFNKVFKDFARNIDIAVFKLDASDSIGHENINKAFPLGTEAVINLIGEDFQLEVNSGMAINSYNEL